MANKNKAGREAKKPKKKAKAAPVAAPVLPTTARPATDSSK
jgi:hypothetical protein